MAHTRRTLALNKKWDLELNSSGLLATVCNASATAQNVANEVRLFTQDAYFNQDQGIPHFNVELGRQTGVTAALLRSHLRKAALRVKDVADVTGIVVDSFDCNSRTLSGQLTITTQETLDGELRIAI